MANHSLHCRSTRLRIGAVVAALAAVAPASAVAQSLPPQQRPPAIQSPQAPGNRAPVVAPSAPSAPAAAAQQPIPQPPSPVGTWIDHTGRGAIDIQPCGEGLCGFLVWMKEPNDKKGQPLRDSLNEDRAKRRRQVCGLQIIGGLQAMRDGSWDRGWIYDPEQGESFDVELRLRSADQLQVKGYKGLKFLSETFQWRRAAAPLAPVCPPTPA